jgi:hypothetical protein
MHPIRNAAVKQSEGTAACDVDIEENKKAD